MESIAQKGEYVEVVVVVVHAELKARNITGI